jgi:low affinity Fe/Cu permease
MSSRLREAAEDRFATLAARTSAATGSFWAFGAALSVIVCWALSGPIFGFSTNWQLVVNTGTTIVTFLMVFVIQHAQNKEMRAVQLKLDEIIAAAEGASNQLIDIEDLPERELEVLYRRFRHLASSSAVLAAGARTTVENDARETRDAAPRIGVAP